MKSRKDGRGKRRNTDADERLFAAGAVVGGHDQASDGTGMGVAILTGWLAGRAAGGTARA